jgi:pimeloyl-ACP methyl ester carboxylesterase
MRVWIAAPVLLVLGFIALGGAVSAVAGSPPPRGQLIDVGGRSLHIICEGPRSNGPTVVFEAGAFGFSADWGAVQPMVTARGWRSCAYDRAGLGFSDTGPAPRDAMSITADLERLLKTAGEPGPFILTGHSMAGLYAPLYARRFPDQVAGLVLADPSVADFEPEGLMDRLSEDSLWAAIGGSVGAFKLLPARLADQIGLPPAAHAEKGWAFQTGRHNRTAHAEERAENRSTRQLLDAGPLDPALPVAVVTAGPDRPERPGRKESQAAAARASAHGYYLNVPEATHDNLLGPVHGVTLVDAIARVRAAHGF